MSSQRFGSRACFRALRVLDGEQTARAKFDHRSVVNLSSNNYLGLTTHPLLRQRAREAIQTFGVGSGSVRTIAGTMALHVELEQRLAAFKSTEAAVVFQSGFAANAGTVVGHAGTRRLDRVRRAEPRQHHRRRAAEPRRHQGVPPPGCRPRRAPSSKGCRARGGR